jgi:hypothetical protein
MMMATIWILPITMLLVVMVLLLPSSGVMMVGAIISDVCEDTADVFQLKGNTRSCDFIQGKNKNKRKKLCKKKTVANKCSKTCGLCDRTKCPKKSGSRTFDKKCTPTFQDKLECNYDYIFTGCNWDEIKCSEPQKSYFCEGPEWQFAVPIQVPCIQVPCSGKEDSSEDFPVEESCIPCPTVKPAGKCPKDAPVNQSDCTQYKKRLGDRPCDYDFRYTGCNLGEVKERGCTSFSSFECTEENKWQELIKDPIPCNIE